MHYKRGKLISTKHTWNAALNCPVCIRSRTNRHYSLLSSIASLPYNNRKLQTTAAYPATRYQFSLRGWCRFHQCYSCSCDGFSSFQDLFFKVQWLVCFLKKQRQSNSMKRTNLNTHILLNRRHTYLIMSLRRISFDIKRDILWKTPVEFGKYQFRHFSRVLKRSGFSVC